jgi:hypothetical protein
MDVQPPSIEGNQNDVGHIPLAAMEGLDAGDNGVGVGAPNGGADVMVGTVATHGTGFRYTSAPASLTQALSRSRDRTGYFVRFANGDTGEAVQYQAMQGLISEYKGVPWTSTAPQQHLIVMDGAGLEHKIVCEDHVNWVVWLTSTEEPIDSMLDADDAVLFDTRVDRYKQRLRQNVKKLNGLHQFVIEERGGAPLNSRRHNARMDFPVLTRRWQAFSHQQQQGYRDRATECYERQCRAFDGRDDSATPAVLMHVYEQSAVAGRVKTSDRMDIPLIGAVAMEGCLPKLMTKMDVGKRDVPCTKCGALHWLGEAGSDGSFHLCCNNGKTTAALDAVGEPLCPTTAPAEVNDVFDWAVGDANGKALLGREKEWAILRSFMRGINGHLAMGSVRADYWGLKHPSGRRMTPEEFRSSGCTSVNLGGRLSHSIPSHMSAKEGAAQRNAQLYVLDDASYRESSPGTRCLAAMKNGKEWKWPEAVCTHVCHVLILSETHLSASFPRCSAAWRHRPLAAAIRSTSRMMSWKDQELQTRLCRPFLII